MSESNNGSMDLRRQAEEFLKVGPPSKEALPESKDALVRLVHELQVHQVELEIQNEELKQARAENEQLLERFTELYDFAPVGYMSLAVDGTILQSNLAAARLLSHERQKLQQQQLATFFTLKDRKILLDSLQHVVDENIPQICTVKLDPTLGQQKTLQIEAVRAVSGEECQTIITDISERLAHELELKTLNDNLNEKVAERTKELTKTVDLMVGREIRMSGLKSAVKKLRKQLLDAGMTPIADDPIFEKN